MPRQQISQTRFGIGEWFGHSFANLTQQERIELAREQLLVRGDRPVRNCIPRSTSETSVPCSKVGGVCSLRQYIKDGSGVHAVPGNAGSIRTTCPYRFEEAGKVFSWIGETILGHKDPDIAKEIGFLERELADGYFEGGREDVGRIDHVLIHPNADPLRWCALEVQSVYFSGPAMGTEFKHISTHLSDEIPFPTAIRRPDYRSSGPKRLMPQLQIKVPSLRRWGKKMAVLVDADFFQALGQMDDVKHVSNCDIAWFIVRYERKDGLFRLIPDRVQYTTLERAVEGLTAGRPVSLEVFENRLRAKMHSGGPMLFSDPTEIIPDE